MNPANNHFRIIDFAWLNLKKVSNKIIYKTSCNLYFLKEKVNFSACIVADDEFAPSLAGLELMGGNSRGIGNITSHAEFNFHADPEAAHIVLTR